MADNARVVDRSADATSARQYFGARDRALVPIDTTHRLACGAVLQGLTGEADPLPQPRHPIAAPT